MLATLWAADGALTPGRVQEQLGGELAYTTVVTILSRLHDKGVLARARIGRAYAYSPVQDEAGLVARRMRRLLDAEPDRRMVLARFVTDLSGEDEQLLRELLGGAVTPSSPPPAGERAAPRR